MNTVLILYYWGLEIEEFYMRYNFVPSTLTRVIVNKIISHCVFHVFIRLQVTLSRPNHRQDTISIIVDNRGFNQAHRTLDNQCYLG